MISLIFMAATLQAKPVDKAQPQSYQLRYFQGEYILRQGRSAWRTRVPAPTVPPVTSVAYRKDDKWAVWDERGLTVRVGEKVTSTKLDAISRSPKIFPRAELLDSLERMRKGERSPFAGGLAGSRRVANEVFFVPRWMDSKGLAWLECLVKVDLSKANPKPELVLRIPGLTVQSQLIDQWLSVGPTGLRLPVRGKTDWSLLTIEGAKISAVVQAAKLISLQEDRYIQESPDGMKQFGTIDWDGPSTAASYESRSDLAFVPGDAELLVQKEGRALSLYSLENGAIWPITEESSVAKIGPFVLTYSAKTTGAVVYQRSTGVQVAAWKGVAKK